MSDWPSPSPSPFPSPAPGPDPAIEADRDPVSDEPEGGEETGADEGEATREGLPTMSDLDGLAHELDQIDATLARMDTEVV